MSSLISCPNDGHPVSDDAESCPKCGKKILKYVTSVKQKKYTPFIFILMGGLMAVVTFYVAQGATESLASESKVVTGLLSSVFMKIIEYHWIGYLFAGMSICLGSIILIKYVIFGFPKVVYV